MLSPQYFFNRLRENRIDFFTGVPDSLLKSVCAYITDHSNAESHIIAANEGSAIGLAAGYYLSTGRIPVVYMQNSGLGNAVNPLLSLVDKEVYHIPMILLIGWRGEPDVKDEPQHIKQGKVTLPLLDAMGVKHLILASCPDEFDMQLCKTLEYIQNNKAPVAFIVQKGTFENYVLQQQAPVDYPMMRETAVQTAIDAISEKAIVVATTGMISRELFEYRELLSQGHERDFLTVGSMGHASQIALGIALQAKDKSVYCFDGDGAVLMHMGALATIGSLKPANFFHLVVNNGAHDSVGGQPTVGHQIDIPAIALSCGYAFAVSVKEASEFKNVLRDTQAFKGPVLIEVKVRQGARKDLGRPTTTPVQNKSDFMQFLSK